MTMTDDNTHAIHRYLSQICICQDERYLSLFMVFASSSWQADIFQFARWNCFDFIFYLDFIKWWSSSERFRLSNVINWIKQGAEDFFPPSSVISFISLISVCLFRCRSEVLCLIHCFIQYFYLLHGMDNFLMPCYWNHSLYSKLFIVFSFWF